MIQSARAILGAAIVAGLLAPMARAGEAPVFPPGAEVREGRLFTRLPPAASQCAVRQGRGHSRGPFGEADARAAVQGCDRDGADIQALAFIALMESGKSAQEDLRAVAEEVRAANQAKAKLREAEVQVERERMADRKDSLSDLSQMQSLRLQMYMDRRSKLYETLSNMMKKAGDTDSTIVGNLK